MLGKSNSKLCDKSLLSKFKKESPPFTFSNFHLPLQTPKRPVSSTGEVRTEVIYIVMQNVGRFFAVTFHQLINENCHMQRASYFGDHKRRNGIILCVLFSCGREAQICSCISPPFYGESLQMPKSSHRTAISKGWDICMESTLTFLSSCPKAFHHIITLHIHAQELEFGR